MRIFLLTQFLLSALAASADAQRQPAASDLDLKANWKLDTLTLKDGKQRRGLLRAKREDEIDFVEVVRPPGKPMYLVGISFDPRSVAKIEELSDDERNELLARISPLLTLRSRALIEAGRMEDVKLQRDVFAGRDVWRYRRKWFEMVSTADEETTRRTVVRLEQIFRAFQRLLPARGKPRGYVLIALYGSTDEYRRDLMQRGLQIESPAWYSPRENIIAAGSDVTRFAEEMVRMRDANAARLAQYEAAHKSLTARLAVLSEQLARAGFSRDEIKAEVRTRRASLDNEKNALLTKSMEIERRNNGRYTELTRDMYRRLYHEALHAWLHNFVFTGEGEEIPRWLNEGLAQVFEHGQLDSDTLRLDAPRELLLSLQSDLSSRPPLRLAELLSADERAFLLTHEDVGVSRRHYMYAWGVAHYLTFHQDLLSGTSLTVYAAPAAQSIPPERRFEQLVKTPLRKFEAQWRDEMLKMPPPRK